MLREEGLAADVVTQVSVNQQEYQKFCYLIKVMDAVDRAHAKSLDYCKELKRQDGTQAEMDFDWRGVVNHVQPQLHVLFLQDKHRFSQDQTFVRFPWAVVVARTACLVELEQVFELTLEEMDAHQSAKQSGDALSSLESVVLSLEGKRQVDGERLIRQLKRVLRSE
jgi:hypothetical protein